MSSFLAFELNPSLQSTLKKQGFVTPTEIQERALPALLKGESVVGVAETGSGKTLAYALSVLHKMKQLEEEGDPVSMAGQPRAVVIVPSSDLGEQVTKVLKVFACHALQLGVDDFGIPGNQFFTFRAEDRSHTDGNASRMQFARAMAALTLAMDPT